MSMLDLEPAAAELSALIAGVPDEMLYRPTPCPAYRVGDLIDHVGGLALAFAAAAAKNAGSLAGADPSGDAARLGQDWRTRIPRDLAALAAAWRNQDAWTGMTHVGGIDLPGEVAGLVAVDELVVHGWDIARASGHRLDPDPAALEAVHGFLAQAAAADPGPAADRDGPFGPPVAVPDDAPLLDRVVGLAGRDPAWQAPVPAYQASGVQVTGSR
jgi:uncharacterized protein (TIGR03086 family)